MATVNQLLSSKGKDIWHVSPDNTVYEALGVMADKDVGALVVLDGGKLIGMISERDYARQVILKKRSSESTSVREIMKSPVVCAPPTQKVEECLALMTEKRIRHLPIMDGDQLLGVISIGDLVKSIIDEQRITIEHLERYITS